jgi:membrane peptidoglycan carboxypeptidase
MKAAIVAVEDRRFYEHQGVDWQGTMRAVIANSASGDVVQGASTLTQQYVKNYFLYVAARTETERLKATEQTPARKLKEAQIALQMERNLSKEEILARYLLRPELGREWRREGRSDRNPELIDLRLAVGQLARAAILTRLWARTPWPVQIRAPAR